MRFQNISNEKAKFQILSYLKKRKLKGIHSVQILEITSDLHLPGPQVDDIMEELEKQDFVSERK